MCMVVADSARLFSADVRSIQPTIAATKHAIPPIKNAIGAPKSVVRPTRGSSPVACRLSTPADTHLSSCRSEVSYLWGISPFRSPEAFMDVGPEVTHNVQLLFHTRYIWWSFVHIHSEHAGDKYFKLVYQHIHHACGERSGVSVALRTLGTKGGKAKWRF